MEKTWASGSVELLKHAYVHMQENTAFDKRVAFISIDNSVELAIKTYLSLPKRLSYGSKPNRKEIEEAYNNFTNYLDLLVKYSNDKLVGIDVGDIEHYHRIRNKLYHDGTGLSVDDEYLNAYYTIGALILKKLFNVEIAETVNTKEYSTSNLIRLWDDVEVSLNSLMKKYEIHEDTYKWEEMIQKNLLDFYEISYITALRMKRNFIVHSESKASIEDIRLFMDEAKLLLVKFKNR